MATCPNCGAESPEGFRFCPHCGAPFAPAPPPRTERRVVTVLFCDLVGFTERSDRADPEDVRATLRPFHAVARWEIERHGGTLDKFIGDAAMGVFGSPVAHEDDPERAVLAGLAILDGMSRQRAGASGPALQIRVGINTGEAAVTLAAGVQEGENVAGDVVNTASRLQSVAPVGGVVVGERTYLATRDLIDYETVDPVTVKGKADPLPVWRVVGRAAGRRRGRAGGGAFVGRDAERDLLVEAFREALDRRERRVVAVLGESGVGKSRLVAEARRRVEGGADGTIWREGRCLPYGDGIAFWPIGEIVKAQAAILDTDGPEEREGKLAATIEHVVADPADRAWLRTRLAPLVGLSDGSGAGTDREESFAAWRRFLEAVAAGAPLVVVVEDLHWADPAVVSFLKELAESNVPVPMLVIVTARAELDERHPGWEETLRGPIRVHLQPLTDDDAALLVADLLGRAEVADEVVALLVDRTGGNPLYAEEFARMLLERGLLDERGRPAVDLETLTFPDSVQAIIAARLDTLEAERKPLLQDASVIGRVFWSGAVAALGERDDGLVLEGLARLADREFVRAAAASTMAGQAEYTFWHGLIRDVTYGQISRAARAAKHRAAATWIEAIAGERADDLAEILAYHATAALDLARAAGETEGLGEMEDAARRHLGVAGRRAMALDVGRAERHLRRALDLTPAGHPDRPSIEAGLAEAAFQGGRHEEAEGLFRAAIDGLRALGRVEEAADAAIRLSVVVEYRGDPSGGRAILADAIATLERLPPGAALARALAESAGTLVVASRYHEAIADAERALHLAGSLGDAETEARAHNFRGYSRVALGDADGLAELRESVETARRLGLGRATAVGYSNLAAALHLVEGSKAMLESLREAVVFAERRGLLEMASFLRNSMLTPLIHMGEWDEVLRLGAEVAEEARRAGAEYEELYAEVDRAHVLLSRGDPGSPALADALLARARPIGDAVLLMWALIAGAMGRATSGDAEGAAALLREALEITRGDALVERATELTELVRAAVATGDLRLAEELMDGVDELPLPKHRIALLASRAAVAEAKGALTEALALHEDAAARWEAFAMKVDRGHSLLGAGRCLARLGRPREAAQRLAAAREVFARIGAAPVLAQIDALSA